MLSSLPSEGASPCGTDPAKSVRTCHRARIYVGNVHLRTKLHSDSDIERDGMVNRAGWAAGCEAIGDGLEIEEHDEWKGVVTVTISSLRSATPRFERAICLKIV